MYPSFFRGSFLSLFFAFSVFCTITFTGASNVFASDCGSITTGTDWKDVQVGSVTAGGVKITLSADCLIDGVELKLGGIGSPAARPLKLYSDSSGLPGTLLDTGTNVDSNVGYPTSQFELSTMSGGICGTSGTAYWIVMEKNGDTSSDRILYNINYSASDKTTNADFVSSVWSTSNDPAGGIGRIDGTFTTCGGGGSSPQSTTTPDVFNGTIHEETALDILWAIMFAMFFYFCLQVVGLFRPRRRGRGISKA